MVCLLAFMTVAAGYSSRVLHRPSVGIQHFEPPVGWELSSQPSYPHLLVLYTHHQGGRLTINRAATAKSPAAVASETKAALEKGGYTELQVVVRENVARLRGRNGERIVVQDTRVLHNVATIVTVAGPLSRANEWTHDLDEAMRSLVLTDTNPSNPPDAGAL